MHPVYLQLVGISPLHVGHITDQYQKIPKNAKYVRAASDRLVKFELIRNYRLAYTYLIACRASRFVKFGVMPLAVDLVVLHTVRQVDKQLEKLAIKLISIINFFPAIDSFLPLFSRSLVYYRILVLKRTIDDAKLNKISQKLS